MTHEEFEILMEEFFSKVTVFSGRKTQDKDEIEAIEKDFEQAKNHLFLTLEEHIDFDDDEDEDEVLTNANTKVTIPTKK